MVFCRRNVRLKEAGSESLCRWAVYAAAFCAIFVQLLVADSVTAGSSLFDEIGMGADWGPHWATGHEVSQGDKRDNQNDGAFPAEICLVANAGFKTIRMYGESVATWIAVLDAVDDYNRGKLNCTPPAPAQPCNNTTKPCMSVVYQVGICGPDPRTLTWNGLIPDDNITKVRCHVHKTDVESEPLFAQSVLEETAKLKWILRYAAPKFASHVPLVIVGNEILYSRGVCSDGSKACTENDDCPGATCHISHFCSNEPSSPDPPNQCSGSTSCSNGGTCTDVTNFKAIEYAFDQVHETLANSLPSGTKLPKLTISLQADVLSSPAFGDNWETADLMYSRQLIRDKLVAVGNVLAVNVYPDQWGLVLEQSSDGYSYPSCITKENAVLGTTLPTECGSMSAPNNKFLDYRTNPPVVAHSIDNYMQLFKNRYYQNLEVLIAETGWHTNGTCSGYNDRTSAYSIEDAAVFYSDLYQYLQSHKIPVFVFELFDQKTKTCDTTGPVPGEANYGIFDNFCRTKGDKGLYSNLLPPQGPGSGGPNLDMFQAMLDDDGVGGKSCGNQTLVVVQGTGENGACYHDPEKSCQQGYPLGGTDKSYACPPGPIASDGIHHEANPCMWGICTNVLPRRGCNPDDPKNKEDGCTCVRSGACANTGNQAGVYVARYIKPGSDPQVVWNAACVQDSDCDNAIAPFTANTKCSESGNCGCFAEIAPSTMFRTFIDYLDVEGPGFQLSYQTPGGTFQFNKKRTLLPLFPGGGNVSSVWGNIFMGKKWNLLVKALPVSQVNGDDGNNTVATVTTGPSGFATWTYDWGKYKYPKPNGTPVTVGGGNARNNVEFPRGFLTKIPTVPRQQANLALHRHSLVDKLIITNKSGRFDQQRFRTTDDIYVSWAVTNDGEDATAIPFHCALSVDGDVKTKWKRSAPLNPGNVITVKRFLLGRLPAGTHQIKLVADWGEVIEESDESDNALTKTITVINK